MAETEMFKNMIFYFHPARLSTSRLNLFTTRVLNHGGQVVKISDLATHVVVEETCNKSALPTSLWTNKTNVVVGSLWLSHCLNKKTLVDQQQYVLKMPTLKRTSSSPEPSTSKKIELNPATEEICINTSNDVKKYACSQASTASEVLCNAAVICELQKLVDVYRARGDQWRVRGYEKAISAIRRYGKEITTYEEVVELEGVGAKMAAKVMEVLTTGRLRKADVLCDTEQDRIMQQFSLIWGAGPATANAWYIKGHRTLKDLSEKESLTKQQKIGIKYYEEFLERIPRSEVEEIGQKVTVAAGEVDRSLTTMLCGSYRRGKLTCGDVDVVVIRPNRLSSKDILMAILSRLKVSGFITDDLVSLEKSGNQRKYLGVCKLPGEGHPHRRLDIFVVPQSELACAVMHYTGSAMFNRSIRLLAARLNMHLSEHNLAAGVLRQGMEIQNKGYILPTPTEESIFEHLGLEYRLPEERDH